MELLIVGIITALNLIIILKKVKLGRYEDALLDSALFITVVSLFSGSYGGMVVSMIASLVISIYLFANPPITFRKLMKDNNISLKGLWESIISNPR